MIFNRFKKDNGGEGGKWIPYTIAACSAVVLYTIINNIPAILRFTNTLSRLLMPIFIGLAIAYLVTPAIKNIDRHLEPVIKNFKIRNIVSIVIAMTIITVFLAILIASLVPQIIDSIIQFVNNINLYSTAVNDTLYDLERMAMDYNIDMERVTSISTDLIDKSVLFITDNLRILVGSSFHIGGDAASLLLGIILAMYFLASKHDIFDGMDRLLRNTVESGKYERLKVFLKRCNDICESFIVGDIIDAVIVGAVNFIFMYVGDMPYAILISVVVAVTNLAPTFGPFVGAFIGGFILLFADSGHTITFLIFTLILQLIDGYIIKPKLFGSSMGVPGVWITVAIIVGGKLFGVLGILLAVPFVGIITFLYRDYIDGKEEAKKQLVQDKD